MTAHSPTQQTDLWRPGATLAALRARAETLRAIRAYFDAAGVLEVETPLLARFSVTDPAIAAVAVPQAGTDSGAARATWFLQTSPEYAMKRLLAAGSGSIYQISKAFRCGESGRRHALEFTLLEWYRLGFDQQALMDDVANLLAHLTGTRNAIRRSYRTMFRDGTGIDPVHASDAELRAAVQRLVPGWDPDALYDRAIWLDLIFSHALAPTLGHDGPEFIFDYPLAQAALARRSPDDADCAARFELFVGGMEIANGYHELTDAAEQRARFAADNARRRQLGLPERDADPRLLAALDYGLPDCAGVALGIDRLLLLLQGRQRLEEVIAFAGERA
ncbi:MAG: EF-P lysine aminoacylase GenX [Gammaproteobacteria bacterium]|nr:EF-P lysine aminoacylase GenX [Gammaproteobacteria bacterium]